MVIFIHTKQIGKLSNEIKIYISAASQFQIRTNAAMTNTEH